MVFFFLGRGGVESCREAENGETTRIQKGEKIGERNLEKSMEKVGRQGKGIKGDGKFNQEKIGDGKLITLFGDG